MPRFVEALSLAGLPYHFDCFGCSCFAWWGAECINVVQWGILLHRSITYILPAKCNIKQITNVTFDHWQSDISPPSLTCSAHKFMTKDLLSKCIQPLRTLRSKWPLVAERTGLTGKRNCFQVALKPAHVTAGSYYSLFLGTSHQTSFKHQVKFALQQSKPLLSHLEGFSLQIQVSCALNFL